MRLFLVVLWALAFTQPVLADTLIDDVRGRTLTEDGEVRTFTGLLIGDDGRVEKLLRERDKRPKEVDYKYDGKGRVLLPGFVDGHVRLIDTGFALQRLDLTDAASLGEAQAKIAHYADAHPGKPWILGQGWDELRWGMAGFPTAVQLDAAIAARPTWFVRADGQVGWANSVALAAAGITAATKAPRGGAIGMTDGQPNGILSGTAMQLIEAAAPKPRPLDRDLALREVQAALLVQGITTVTDMGTTIEDWQAIRRAGDADELRLRIVSYADDIADMILIGGSSPGPWLYEGRLKMVGVYLRLDGSVSAGTAWSGDAAASGGNALLTPGQLRNKITRAAMDGFQVAVRASGDLAVREYLDALEEVAPTFPGDRRWRLEAPQAMTVEDRQRVAGLDVAILLGETQGGMTQQSLREELLWQEQVPVAIGSMQGLAPGDPLAMIMRMRAEQDMTSFRLDTNSLSYGVGRSSLWRAMTLEAARAAFAEDRLGSLEPGRQADFILLDGDPLNADNTRPGTLQVIETWIGGKPVYRR